MTARQTVRKILMVALVGFAAGNDRAAELSDNLAKVTSGTESATINRWLAASFRTDASTTYQLNSVTLLLASTSPGTAALDLYSDGGLEPGTLVATLTSPASYSSAPAAATFNADGLTLDPNTTYWVALRVLSGTFDWAWTADNTGNGVGFDPTWDVSEDAGSAWYTYDVYPTQFRVTVDATNPIVDCNQNGVPDDVDIGNGTSLDCNANGKPDSCDITSGMASDCNGNGVPDSCDLGSHTSADCNGNGVPDSCDLSSNTAPDCNGNGVPDSCDVASRTSPDCNRNGKPDSCDVASGSSTDINANGLPDECETLFHRGDPDSSGTTDITDGITIFTHLFLGDPVTLSCRESADTNNDGAMDITDGIYLLSWLFTGGPALAAPGPTGMPCDLDPDPAGSPGDLGCESYPGCR